MGLAECYSFVKYALVCVTILFWGDGLLAVFLAVWILIDPTFLVSLAQEQQNFSAGLYILLAAGLLTLVVAILGCCGALRESRCMLVSFFSCLLVVIVAQIAAGAWLYTNSARLEELLKSSVVNTVKNEYGEIESRTMIVDSFQSNLGCCGASGPGDWAGSKYAHKDPSIPLSLTVSTDSKNTYRVPESCCKDKDSVACSLARNIKLAGIVSPAIYSEGCIDKLTDALKSQSSIMIGVAIGVAILELLGLILSLILCCAIRSSDRYKA